jgi:hypothetical protein
MPTQMNEDQATKKQSRYFMYASLTLIGTIVLILLLWNFGVPLKFWWLAGGIGAAIDAFLWAKFFKLTDIKSKFEDGGSSVK